MTMSDNVWCEDSLASGGVLLPCVAGSWQGAAGSWQGASGSRALMQGPGIPHVRLGAHLWSERSFLRHGAGTRRAGIPQASCMWRVVGAVFQFFESRSASSMR